MPGPVTQLRALLALRSQMARTPGLRLGILLAALFFGWLFVALLGSGERLEGPLLATAIQLAPAAFLGFGFLAIIAPLTAGGGAEVIAPDQLTAFPVRPSTQFLGGLALAPLNLVWVIQLLVMAAVTSYLTIDGSLLRGGLTSVFYIAAVTTAGQAIAWLVVGARQTRRGRRVVQAAGALLMITAVVVVRTGRGEALLDASPTRHVVTAILSGSVAIRQNWLITTGALAVLTAMAFLLGTRACRWALRRPSDAGLHRRTTSLRRRSAKGGPLRELVAVDRASVWRAPALRRGGLVLAILPGLIAAGAAVPWESMIVMPGLIAAGAGLLFGVNAFCLDGSGAVWLASLPHDPKLVARAKAIVLTETVLAAALLAVLAGSLRSPGDPTGAQVTAILASAIACSAVVVAGALKMSVRHPHRAELRGPRDAVAPPGALAAASARLALPAAFVGILLGAASNARLWWWPPLLALPILLLCVLSVMRTLRRYDDPFVRARIVQTVAAG